MFGWLCLPSSRHYFTNTNYFLNVLILALRSHLSFPHWITEGSHAFCQSFHMLPSAARYVWLSTKCGNLYKTAGVCSRVSHISRLSGIRCSVVGQLWWRCYGPPTAWHWRLHRKVANCPLSGSTRSCPLKSTFRSPCLDPCILNPNIKSNINKYCGGGIAQSILHLATSWNVRGSNPVWGRNIFSTWPDLPWGSPGLQYDELRVFFFGYKGLHVALNSHTAYKTPRLKKEKSYISTHSLGIRDQF